MTECVFDAAECYYYCEIVFVVKVVWCHMSFLIPAYSTTLIKATAKQRRILELSLSSQKSQNSLLNFLKMASALVVLDVLTT